MINNKEINMDPDVWKDDDTLMQEFFNYVNSIAPGMLVPMGEPIVLDDSIRPEDVVMVGHPICGEQII
jgi:hypothetical protein